MLRLDDGIWLIPPLAPPRYPYGNCLYVEDERSTIIDLGAGYRAFEKIPREKVQLVLLTHFHLDHRHSDWLFPVAPMYAGWQEAEGFYDEEAYLRHFCFHVWDKLLPDIKVVPFAYAAGIYTDEPGVFVWPSPREADFKGDHGREQKGPPGFRKLSLAGTFKDGERIDLGRRQIVALHLPGHIHGHYGFYFEREDILFSGDLDFVGSGPWYYAWTSDVSDIFASVQRVREIDPALIVPSHRRIIRREEKERCFASFLDVLLRREEKILSCLHEKPCTIEQLAVQGIAFPQPAHVYEVFWERVAVCHHLRKLEQEGRVKSTEDGYYYLN